MRATVVTRDRIRTRVCPPSARPGDDKNELTVFLKEIIFLKPRPLEGRLSRGVAQAGRRKGCRGDARHGLPGRRRVIPALGRCGARGPVSQAGTRAMSGLRPRPLMGLRQELAGGGSTLGNPPSAARHRSENAAMVRRETRRFSTREPSLIGLVASLGAPSPSLQERENLSPRKRGGMQAIPAPQRIRAAERWLTDSSRPRGRGTHIGWWRS